MTSRRIYAETSYPRIHLGGASCARSWTSAGTTSKAAKRELYDLAVRPARAHEPSWRSSASWDAHGRRSSRAFPRPWQAPTAASAADTERLAALGYLGGAVQATGPLPDPRERIGVLKDVKAAFRLAAEGRDEDAVVAFRAFSRRYPLLADARYELAQTLMRLGRWDEAYEALPGSLRASPSLAPAMALEMARSASSAGGSTRRGPTRSSPRARTRRKAHELLARIALAGDDLDGAEREATHATRRARGGAGGGGGARGGARPPERFEEASKIVDDALRKRPRVGSPSSRTSTSCAATPWPASAATAKRSGAFREEIRLFPRNLQAYTRLAIVLGHRAPHDQGSGRRAGADGRAAAPGRATLELAAKTLESMGDAAGRAAWRTPRLAPRASARQNQHAARENPCPWIRSENQPLERPR